MKRIYLDHAATTPISQRALALVAEQMAVLGNPSSLHFDGRHVREAVESAREQIAETYQSINGTKKTMVTAEQKLEELKAKLSKKEAECKSLSETLAEYDQKYVRWLYNATNANLTVDQLNAPIPESMKTTSRKGNKK